MITTIDVGSDFYYRLVNRNKYQGDGKHHAEDFRNKYLSSLDKPEAWQDDLPIIIFNFKTVKKLGPSFANEAFAYFTKYATPDLVLKKIVFINLTKVQEVIIKTELNSGYTGE